MPQTKQASTFANQRTSEFPIDNIFLNRWSPRAFDETSISKQDLMTLFEAARWAPSAYNVQPWRFIYSLRDDIHWRKFLSLLDPFNAAWAQRSSVIIFLLSDTLVPNREKPKPFPSHSFDSGAAWIQLALQAQILGYQAHAMGGIFYDEIRRRLEIPARYKVEIGIAIGKVGEVSVLPKDLREREKPSARLALTDLVSQGRFKDSLSAGQNDEH